MDILFRRAQTPGRFRAVRFKLWAKIQLTRDEKAIVSRYGFAEAILIVAIQPKLLLKSAAVAFFAFSVAFYFLTILVGGLDKTAAALSLFVGLVGGYWFFHETRETIYVKDLLHGRDFSCRSVVELARKEAWLRLVLSYLRQVMESAKYWDGTARTTIDPLPKEEARAVILQGL